MKSIRSFFKKGFLNWQLATYIWQKCSALYNFYIRPGAIPSNIFYICGHLFCAKKLCGMILTSRARLTC